MEPSFAILGEPNRRTILSLLLTSERSVGEIEQELESNPTLELADGDADDPALQTQMAEERREERQADRQGHKASQEPTP